MSFFPAQNSFRVAHTLLSRRFNALERIGDPKFFPLICTHRMIGQHLDFFDVAESFDKLTGAAQINVVVGYAVGNKRTITGAVDRVTEENMNTGYVATAVDAIRGKVPGLVISSNGGNVQDNPTIRLRGTTSLSGGNSPLVIMDGVFGDVGMLFSLSLRMTSRKSLS